MKGAASAAVSVVVVLTGSAWSVGVAGAATSQSAGTSVCDTGMGVRADSTGSFDAQRPGQWVSIGATITNRSSTRVGNAVFNLLVPVNVPGGPAFTRHKYPVPLVGWRVGHGRWHSATLVWHPKVPDRYAFWMTGDTRIGPLGAHKSERLTIRMAFQKGTRPSNYMSYLELGALQCANGQSLLGMDNLFFSYRIA